MQSMIRHMQERDRAEVLCMMREFYASDAVWSNGSDEIFGADIDSCLGDCPFLEGYVFEEEHRLQGYAMVAKSFSTEFGKPCIWLEDIYVMPAFRDRGIGSAFMSYVQNKYPGAIFRLEVEPENERAVHVYEKYGFSVIPYMEMKK
ncbi:MAG: GNAT family N-acetyltransferase [Ruminococcaceae bacterium]|nr:GNAT family N-acetyltransferase [Oscillospiraceae bacterium]